ncbi:histidine kinase [Dactylosporangium fulvum]|uniref:histidine kinase n=1 Tax=Dactylosporangium fulvum TaxID=53359 RepID=A0ABY5VV13_9ACTN|nr:histidine kinase [Dactylosporangium fulvum]UWP80899.1 sensor domain-containing protein [Dactylosporangium fulvum]
MTYVRALYRGIVLAGLAVVVLVQFVVSLALLGPGVILGMVFLLPPQFKLVRWLTNRWRRLFADWTGREIPVPYQPPPPPPEPDKEGLYRHDSTLYKTPRFPAFFRKLDWLVKDPATNRDMAWQFWFPFVALLPLGLVVVPLLRLWGPLWTVVVTPVALAALPWTVGAVTRWSAWLLAPRTRPPVSKAIDRVLLAWARCGLLVVSAATQVVLFAFSMACFGLGFGLGIIFLIPVGVSHFRWLANLRRQFAAWSGARIPSPYTPELRPELRPDGLYRVRNNLYKTEAMAAFNARWQWTWNDVASWRDLVWLGVDPVVTVATVGLPVLGGIYGGWGLVFPWLWTEFFDAEWSAWYGAVAGNRTLGLVTGIVLIAVSLAVTSPLLRVHSRWTAVLLRPTKAAAKEAELRERVERLTQTRNDALDTQAAEIRRIERDLHDGAQARLIAVGLTLGAIERLMDTDPDAARKLVAQAKETSATALTELRDLVRGIHPPVLSERGLPDAVRALALDTAAEVTVAGTFDGRPAAPVESAAYFAVSELLANATRHGGAERISIDLRHRDGILRITVTDDGRGGADPSRGTGLRGIERRLGTFDGTLAIHSPSGGPTVATLELPCVLSSPKTSTS